MREPGCTPYSMRTGAAHVRIASRRRQRRPVEALHRHRAAVARRHPAPGQRAVRRRHPLHRPAPFGGVSRRRGQWPLRGRGYSLNISDTVSTTAAAREPGRRGCRRAARATSACISARARTPPDADRIRRSHVPSNFLGFDVHVGRLCTRVSHDQVGRVGGGSSHPQRAELAIDGGHNLRSRARRPRRCDFRAIRTSSVSKSPFACRVT